MRNNTSVRCRTDRPFDVTLSDVAAGSIEVGGKVCPQWPRYRIVKRRPVCAGQRRFLLRRVIQLRAQPDESWLLAVGWSEPPKLGQRKDDRLIRLLRLQKDEGSCRHEALSAARCAFQAAALSEDSKRLDRSTQRADEVQPAGQSDSAVADVVRSR